MPASGGAELRISARFNSVTRLPNYPDFGGQTFHQFLFARNNVTAVANINATATTGTIVGGAACTQP